MTGPVNLASACGDLPSGGDLAAGASHGLTLSIEALLSWTDGMHWGVRITKPKTTASGRKGKPEAVLTLIANDGQTIPDLLRAVATLWEHGDVEVTEATP